jgi:hypothetical protein
MKTAEKANPYAYYQNTEEWAIIEHSLTELIDNQDIELKTAPEYVIGYLVFKLRNKDVEEALKVTKALLTNKMKPLISEKFSKNS